MAYLLDTHSLLWFAADDARLSKKAKSIISDGKNEVNLSSVSVWELSIKMSIGKLKLKITLEKFIEEIISKYEFIPLPVNISHAVLISKLPEIHKIPADKLLPLYFAIDA